MSVVFMSSRSIVGYAGCSRKSFLTSGSGAASPGVTWSPFTPVFQVKKKPKHPPLARPGAISDAEPTVALATLPCAPIGSPAQKRKADWPAEVETADASRRTRGHTNSAAQRSRPLAPSTTCACEGRGFLRNNFGFPSPP